MKFFNFLGKKKRNIKSDLIVKLAYGSAVSSFMPLVNKFPELSVIPDSGLLEDFDILVTNASIGIILLQVSNYFNPKETIQYISEINKSAHDWNSAATSQISDYGNLIVELTKSGEINGREEFSEVTGRWVLYELFESNPHNIELVPIVDSPVITKILGTIITDAFSNFWTNYEFR
jgi:hypothetical protein